MSTLGTRSGTSYGRTQLKHFVFWSNRGAATKLLNWVPKAPGRGLRPQLGDEVTWSDIKDIQLNSITFWI